MQRNDKKKEREKRINKKNPIDKQTNQTNKKLDNNKHTIRWTDREIKLNTNS